MIDKIANLQPGIAEDVADHLFNTVGATIAEEKGEENPYSPETCYFHRGADASNLRLVWSHFREEIHSHARFFGATTLTRLDEIFGGLASLTTLWGTPVIREIKRGDADSFVWRARPVYSLDELQKIWESPSRELGPPPSDKATAGRMNAEGIPVFYGALEEATCVSEVRAPVGSLVILGKFNLLNPTRILDLDALSIVNSDISYFDLRYAEERNREMFLRELVREINRPVMPHEEGREYLATQVVSEYLANRIKPRLHGMTFRSSQTGEEGHNLVLFNWASGVEDYQPRPSTGLRVVLPTRPGILPPGTEPAKTLVLQTGPVEASRENEGGKEESAPNQPEDHLNDMNSSLEFDFDSIKIVQITRIQPQYETLQLGRVHYVSANPVGWRFDVSTPSVTVCSGNQELDDETR